MVLHVTVYRPKFELKMILGEGCIWDTKTQRLYFVDIDTCRVFTYEPSTETLGFETFAHKITAIALLESGNGLLATADFGFVTIPKSSLPFPPTSLSKTQPIIPFKLPVSLSPQEKRFNDGAVDPAGRFLAGTMGQQHDDVEGKMYSLRFNEDRTVSAPLVLENVTCTNGMGWSVDGKTLYFTDSWIKEIAAFDYNNDTGCLSNRRTFSKLNDPIYGEPDGMCMDSAGGVWSARWESGKVLRFNQQGEIDVEIDLPTAWNVTCLVFGGSNLDELYITTADTSYNGAVIPSRPHGGSLFVVKDLGFTGVERYRFKDI